MTIDEAITFCNEKAINIKLKAEPKVFIQLAEWLEELKARREVDRISDSKPFDVLLVQRYNNAIDECLGVLYRNAGKIISIRFYEQIYNEIKQLKEGGANE